MNWFKQQLANVVGTEEPIYGSEAIGSVSAQAATTPFTELTRDDMRWAAMESTCVETQTFYITTASGHIAMAQVIYSNVGGIRTTIQFNSKVFYPDGKKPLWTSDPLKGCGFSEDKTSFFADNCLVSLSEDGTSYTIKSTTSAENAVDITFSRLSPGFVVGKDGTSYFGPDQQNPWGSMRHAFWPRCKVTGAFKTKDGDLNMEGFGLFIHALQGMKPHHAAARWNFANFQSSTHSAVIMEFITPPSYGSTLVNVGGIATDGKILFAGSNNPVSHTDSEEDMETGWVFPKAATFTWGKGNEGGTKPSAGMSGALTPRVDRVDVMAEVPNFVKQIIAGAAGTKPYIYQYGPKLTLKLNADGKETEVEGTVFMEATFIS